jgi:hypothetical protein
MIVESMRLCIC